MTGTEIAIIGMAARLPGAPELAAFWRLLTGEATAIQRLAPEALRQAGFSDRDLADPALVPAFGVLDGVDRFDAAFFGYPAARAAALDPQQRLLLECAWHALEHAGYGPGSPAAAAQVIGAYLSMTGSSYAPGETADLGDGFFALTSRDKDYAATRISYKLDLTGPSLMVQTACSGSLAAVHLAAEALLGGQCDMAIAGGCSVMLPQGAYRQGAGLMLSASGALRAFDAAADGAVPGNGLGVVVLKPLARALADGDSVLAVLLGSAMNNDGAGKADYLAPSVRGQRRVIREALAIAGVPAAAIGYVECHGTGTALGDPVEVRALAQAFAAAGGAPAGSGRTALGTVKARIGHLNVASGIAGLIKTVLALQHRTLPPSPYFRSANPDIDFSTTPFTIPTAPMPWAPIDGRRCAGVSSFGFGGTNVHVVLAEAPPPPPATIGHGPVVLPLSAKTPEALARLMADLADALAAQPDLVLPDVAFTLATGRQAFEHRRALHCRDRDAAIAALRAGGEASGVDWPDAADIAPGQRVPLPGYPFAHTRHWRDPTPTPRAAVRPPTTDVLARVRAVFAATLDEPAASLDPDATYDRFGIDSLLVSTITAELRRHYPALRSTALFEHTTLRKLAAHLAEQDVATGSAADALPAGDGAIAVIGLAGRYPGAADIDAFWDNLRAGRSGIGEIPADRWDAMAHYDPQRADASHSRWGGFIADADCFDPLCFGISPREAKLLDPQQRLVLQTAWHALEDAGYTPAALKASGAGDVGVFIGVMNQPYRLLGLAAAASGLVVQANHWSVANRVSYHFDLRGPSLAVDTGCSASLTALHLACESLRRGACAAALAGGVNLILHPVQQVELSRTGVLARSPHCAVFGAAADGFVQGEGVGVAVLKPLARALADGDHIHGVILGSAINAGGRTAGYTVPNPAAQTAVVQAALADAGVAADSIGYVECHGTATALGDPIELAALSDAFRAAGRGRSACVIGSVKSNIGHLESAAGIAGLSKLLLQLTHGEIAPSLACDPPNPAIDFAAGPFVVARTTAPWPDGLRRGGLSSFGAGGANAHMVVEPAPPRPPTPAHDGPVIVPLSARTPEALAALVQRFSAWLDRMDDEPPGLLADIAFTLTVGRVALEARAAFVVADLPGLRAALRAFPAITHAGSEAAAAWCRGADVPLAERFTGQRRQRLRLPGTVFARDRYWLPEVTGSRLATATAPLLGTPVPVLAAEARWRTHLPATHPLLAGHVVAGRPMLPGVATLELAAAAARALGQEGPFAFRDIVWSAPFVAGPDTLEVVVRNAGEALAFELTSGATVISRGTVATNRSAPPPSTDLAAARARCGRHLETAAVYAKLAGVGLDYGPGFRAVTSLALGPDEAVASVGLADPSVWAGTELPPGLLDALLQTAAMIVFAQPGATRLLPLSVDAVTMFAPLPTQGHVHARRVSAAERLDFASFDVMLTDAAGAPVLTMQGLAGRIDRPAATPAAEGPQGWFYAPVWQALPAPPAAALVGASVIVLPAGEAVPVPPDATVIRLGQGADPPDVAAWQARLAADTAALAFICPSDPAAGEAATMTLFRALKALRRQRGFSPTRVAVLAHAGLSGEAAAWAAAARALARVAGHEWTDWTVCAATLDDWASLPAALADPGDPRGLELAWRGGVRHVRGLSPLTLPPAPDDAFRHHGVYFILGGGGGIGLQLGRHLARTHQARLALVGRHPATAAQEAALAEIRAAGGEAVHLVADATRPGDLRRAMETAQARFGPLHGAIHAAIVMDDRSLELMEEATFRAGLDVKTRGTVALAEAAVAAGVAWLGLFSSVNSLVANAGQANYVAGCAFKDAYGLHLASTGMAVKVINWGFWGEVGRVADDAYRARLTRRGVLPIGTQEGIAAALAILSSPVAQVVALKADGKVLRQLGLAEDAFAALVTTVERHVAAQADRMRDAWAPYAALEDLSRRRLAQWWHATSTLRPGERLDAAALAAGLGVVPRHAKLFAAMLDALERAGAVQRSGDGFIGADPSAPPDLAAFRAAHPDMTPHAKLLDACARAYSDVLAGRTLATEVMFPDSSMALVEGIYHGNRWSDYFNALAAEAVAAALAGVSGPPRVLEIGAGTGGTTRAVLPRIAGINGLEYCYTDISLAFAKLGRRTFAGLLPGLSCRALDISGDLAAQAMPLGGFDVVLGANVVHATPDLSRTLGNASALLRPGGMLVLYELTSRHDFGTLTFGLLDGWWLAEDARMPHAPLLDVPGWRERLLAAGFSDVAAFGAPGETVGGEFRHAVIVARKKLLQTEAAPAAAPESASLRERLRRRNADQPAEPAPADLVAVVRATVAEVLEMQLADVRTDRSFADYGADSILGVTLVETLGKRLGVAISPTELFSHQTVEKLAAHLAGRARPVAVAAPEPAATGAAADGIAIIGWSGRFPGARDIATLWRNFAAGVDSVGLVPPTRWDHDALYDPAATAPGRTNCRHGGFLDDIEYFDPLFFGLSPSEAAAMDPQQRVFLEEAWHALEDAGYAAPGLEGATVGVFAGTVAGDYDDRLREAGRRPDAHSFMGTAPSMLAARIAYRLNLRGPCLSIDTACSSSLVAVHLACESLRRGESSIALAGGVAVMTTPGFYLAATSAGMLSPSGRCRTLDAAADGFVPAEAAAVVVLKRLADALRDGDHIHGVIRATGMNQDGASNGITAPNGAAQTALLRQVYAHSATDPASIGYVELHGTGTRLGDPIELAALADAFGPAAGRAPWCAIGSAKANLGHTLPAAGVVGLIRAALVLRHRLIPPAVHHHRLNPLIALDGSPFYVPPAATPWPAGPTRAAVSAFGFSGTNAHAVLDAPPPAPAASESGRAWHLAVLSAETEPALRRRCDDLAAWLEAHPEAAIADICFTLGQGRAALRHRIAFRVTDTDALRAALACGEAATDALAQAWVDGGSIDWAAMYPPGAARRLALPVYPFARRRCWPDKPSLFTAVLDELAGGGA